MKKIIVSVTSDLVTDQRVHKVCTTLHTAGYGVLLVGRKKKDSLALETRAYRTHRMKLFFEKGPFFYAEFNLRLFFLLLFRKADILLANDLDTLLPNFLVAKMREIPLAYDNHEYYTGVPELESRPFIQGIWKSIERWIFPKLSHVYTVNASIARLYEEEYYVPVRVVRNIPLLSPFTDRDAPPGFPEGKVILYQGAGINVDRGVEEALLAMRHVKDAVLLIVGGGDAIGSIQNLAKREGLEDRVIFVPKMPFERLKEYTRHASIGLSLDKDTNINYRYSLPNKVFDYIHAGLPILASRVVEVKRIVEDYQVGLTIENHSPGHIADRINEMLSDEKRLATWKTNALKAAIELNWQKEEQVLLHIIQLM